MNTLSATLIWTWRSFTSRPLMKNGDCNLGIAADFAPAALARAAQKVALVNTKRHVVTNCSNSGSGRPGKSLEIRTLDRCYGSRRRRSSPAQPGSTRSRFNRHRCPSTSRAVGARLGFPARAVFWLTLPPLCGKRFNDIKTERTSTT